jgi:urease accessory protein
MSDAVAARLKLQAWLSPAFPAGAFAYSHGLEWAVEAGTVHDRDSLAEWLLAVLERGSARNDAILIAAIVRANGDAARIAEIAELALALTPTRERHLESVQQAAGFAEAIAAAWPAGGAAAPGPNPMAYPVAFAIAVAAHAIPAEEAIPAYLNAFMGNLVSAAIRLSVIGQADGQRILADLLPAMGRIAEAAAPGDLAALAGGAFGVDLASMLHETQYTRLFRS